MQTVQRGTGQGAKRLSGVTVPNHVHRLTVRARRATCEAPLDKHSRCRLRIQRCQFNRHILTLIGRQVLQRGSDSFQLQLSHSASCMNRCTCSVTHSMHVRVTHQMSYQYDLRAQPKKNKASLKLALFFKSICSLIATKMHLNTPHRSWKYYRPVKLPGFPN